MTPNFTFKHYYIIYAAFRVFKPSSIMNKIHIRFNLLKMPYCYALNNITALNRKRARWDLNPRPTG